jgi:hypothetical protein
MFLVYQGFRLAQKTFCRKNYPVKEFINKKRKLLSGAMLMSEIQAGDKSTQNPYTLGISVLKNCKFL